MKICLISDIHFCVRGSSPYFIERQRLFFEKIFFPQLEKNKVTTILDLGDTFEDRKSVNVNGLYHARKMFFDEAEKRNIKIIAILGNHDIFYRNTNEFNSMDIIESAYSNVHLVREYEEFKFGKKTFGLMSWINNDNLEKNMKIIKETSTADYLCLHGEIVGFEMTKGNVADKGLSQDIFGKFDQVLSGHFHIKNKIGNIYYIGNPFQTNWDDYGSDRGFHIYDHEKDEFKFIKNEYENYDVIIYQDVTDQSSFDFSSYDGKIIKILVTKVSELNQANYSKFLETLSKHCHEYMIIEVSEEEIKAPTIVKLKTNTDMIRDYINKLNVDDSQKEESLRIMYELHGTALATRTSTEG